MDRAIALVVNPFAFCKADIEVDELVQDAVDIISIGEVFAVNANDLLGILFNVDSSFRCWTKLTLGSRSRQTPT